MIFFRNQRVDPTASYRHDPLYRLICATGREHLGQTGGGLSVPQQVTNDDSFRTGLPQPGDGNAMGKYTETYGYDAVGNITSMAHRTGSGSWTRRYAYAEPSRITAAEVGNRLSASSLPGDPAAGPYTGAYQHDAHGSMTQMPHLATMTWDEDDRLRSTARQAGTQATFYAYDGAGQRVRKVTDWQTASSAAAQALIKSERIYLGAIEIYREYATDGATLTLSRETLHVADGDKAVVLVETRTAGTDQAPAQVVRYQFGNHLGSAMLELDDQSNIITYEEYFPFGSTSYQAVAAQTDLPKRYRYTGKERDEENDLYYHGARYYAPWLGRWTAADPIGISAGINVYSFVRNRPSDRIDPEGTADEPGWFARHVGPASPLGQWISHADYAGSSFIQDDKKLAKAQQVAEVVTVTAATIATGGAAAEVTATYLAGTGATALETAVISGAVGNVAGGATGRYLSTGFAGGSVSDALKAAADPAAITKDVVVGGVTGGLAYGATRAVQAVGKALSASKPAPIIGKAQVTGGATHDLESKQAAEELSRSPGVTKVFMNRSYRTMMRALGRAFSSLRRPDVGAITKEGKLIAVEVPSPSDVLVGSSSSPSVTQRALINRNLKVQLRMGDQSEGLFIVGATPKQMAPVYRMLQKVLTKN